MFRNVTILVLLLLSNLAVPILAGDNATQFQNLDFEEAFGGQYPPPSEFLTPGPHSVLTSIAIPHWTVAVGQPSDHVLFNSYLLDSPDVEVFSPTEPAQQEVVQGHYAVLLENIDNWNFRDVPVYIAQTGTIPSLTDGQPTESVRFIFTNSSASGIYLSLNGNNIPLNVITVDGHLYELGCNIPETLRGTTTELKIGFAPTVADSYIGEGGLLDSVNFSNEAVAPEPSTFALLGMGVIGLMGYGLKKRRPSGNGTVISTSMTFSPRNNEVHTMRTTIYALCFVLASLAGTAHAQITNGDFSSGLAGWSWFGNTDYWTYTHTNSFGGGVSVDMLGADNYCASIKSNVSISGGTSLDAPPTALFHSVVLSQTFTASAGESLRMDIGTSATAPGGYASVSVEGSGYSKHHIVNAWESVSFPAFTSPGSYTVSIESIASAPLHWNSYYYDPTPGSPPPGYYIYTWEPASSQCITYVSHVDIVPEPSTIALLGMGVLGLIGWAWKRRKA